MAIGIELNDRPLIPLKEAVGLVPYSRDYVARLARENKIVALFSERQWLIDSDSLLNFYEQSKLEEIVRKQHLRQIRKKELEVRDNFVQQVAMLELKHVGISSSAHVYSVSVILCGLLAGLLIQASLAQLTPERQAAIASLPQALAASMWGSAESEPDLPAGETAENIAVETQGSLSLEPGILLVPSDSAAGEAAIADLFSDIVDVTMTGTTTGTINLSGSQEETAISFVRVPAIDHNASSTAPDNP